MENIDMMPLKDLENYTRLNLRASPAEKKKMYGSFYQTYKILIPFATNKQIVIRGVATIDGDFVVNKYEGKTANFIYVQDTHSEMALTKREPFEISYTGWKAELVTIIKKFQDEKKEIKSLFTKDSAKKLKEIRSIPIHEFDRFLVSISSALLKYGKLTDAQEIAFQNVKRRYTPRVPLTDAQTAFLKKLADLPFYKLNDEDKELVCNVYAKACAGTEWTPMDRQKVLNIFKSVQ